jgi:uroporphyrinogen-III synthase
MGNFSGLRVAAFESRLAEETANLIRRHGGIAHVSPSLRAVPAENNLAAVDFAHRLITGQVDVVVFLTGVGFRLLLQQIERHVARDRFLVSLADTVTVARGPKPVAAMRQWGMQPTHKVPEPHTWRELLRLVDDRIPVCNQRVVIQEYGKPNTSLVAGLEARGAQVTRLVVYRWDLPFDTRPLEENLSALARGERDVAVFTSAQQVTHLLSVAQRLGIEAELRGRLATSAVVCSVGPTTSEALRAHGLAVDYEARHPNLGQLIGGAADVCHELRRRKQT